MRGPSVFNAMLLEAGLAIGLRNVAGVLDTGAFAGALCVGLADNALTCIRAALVVGRALRALLARLGLAMEIGGVAGLSAGTCEVRIAEILAPSTSCAEVTVSLRNLGFATSVVLARDAAVSEQAGGLASVEQHARRAIYRHVDAGVTTQVAARRLPIRSARKRNRPQKKNCCEGHQRSQRYDPRPLFADSRYLHRHSHDRSPSQIRFRRVLPGPVRIATRKRTHAWWPLGRTRCVKKTRWLARSQR